MLLTGHVIAAKGRRWMTTVQRLLALAAPSLAVSCKVYVPPFVNVAQVLVRLAESKVTAPGPGRLAHVVVSVPFGNPSGSEALPFNCSLTLPLPSGQIAFVLGPALTWGGLLTITWTTAEVVQRPYAFVATAVSA